MKRLPPFATTPGALGASGVTASAKRTFSVDPAVGCEAGCRARAAARCAAAGLVGFTSFRASASNAKASSSPLPCTQGTRLKSVAVFISRCFTSGGRPINCGRADRRRATAPETCAAAMNVPSRRWQLAGGGSAGVVAALRPDGSLWSPPACRWPFSAVRCGRPSLYIATDAVHRLCGGAIV
jgi:hypothetical protein